MDDENDDSVQNIDWDAMTTEEQVAELNRRGLIGYSAFIIADLKSGDEVAREVSSEPRLVQAKLDDAGKLMFIVEDPDEQSTKTVH